jgi:hypothetical protein
MGEIHAFQRHEQQQDKKRISRRGKGEEILEFVRRVCF